MAATGTAPGPLPSFIGDDVQKLNPDLEGGAFKLVFDRDVPIEMRLQVRGEQALAIAVAAAVARAVTRGALPSPVCCLATTTAQRQLNTGN